MMQPELFDWVPPALEGPRDGESFDGARDGKRLNAQAAAVFRLMRDGKWRSLAEIAHATDSPETSVSARLRDFRKPKFGGYTVERRHIEGGLWHYRVMVSP